MLGGPGLEGVLCPAGSDLFGSHVCVLEPLSAWWWRGYPDLVLAGLCLYVLCTEDSSLFRALFSRVGGEEGAV